MKQSHPLRPLPANKKEVKFYSYSSHPYRSAGKELSMKKRGNICGIVLLILVEIIIMGACIRTGTSTSPHDIASRSAESPLLISYLKRQPANPLRYHRHAGPAEAKKIDTSVFSGIVTKLFGQTGW